MLSIKQTARIISTYAGDTSGVCSALYELGGMTVMHDASGCNSTYNTHDEPRWYDMDSLVFISGLSEMEAMMGDDQKLIDDIVKAAEELHPHFIAIAGSPIPMMIGVDFPAVAQQIENETGIVSFGFPADGMHSYISGASMAFAAVAERLVKAPAIKSGVSEKNIKPLMEKNEFLTEKAEAPTVNILGVTPLDFSVNGTVEAMRQALETGGIKVGSFWAMGSSYEEIENSGSANVNLVVSACGLEAAKVMQRRFGIPYVVGTPCGEKFTRKLIGRLKSAAQTRNNEIVCQPCACQCSDRRVVIIGESVTALSFANALQEETGIGAFVICAVDTTPDLLSDGCVLAWDEDDIIPYLQNATHIIADPMYRPICLPEAEFIELPHEGFSGRIYRDSIPELVTGFEIYILKII